MKITGLAFSGGKDSWAALLLNKDRLHKIQVMWVDSGKNYPELLESIALAESMCPHFVRIKVDRDGQNAHWGIPADVVPINFTRLGQEMGGKKDILVQPHIQCCYENRSVPLFRYAELHGIKEIIFGQRNDDQQKSTARDGTIVNGIKRLHPIETWKEDQVLFFVSQHMELPKHFQFKHSSMDCYDCTAYKTETKDIRQYRASAYPDLEVKYAIRNDALTKALVEELKDA